MHLQGRKLLYFSCTRDRPEYAGVQDNLEIFVNPRLDTSLQFYFNFILYCINFVVTTVAPSASNNVTHSQLIASGYILLTKNISYHYTEYLFINNLTIIKHYSNLVLTQRVYISRQIFY